MKVETGPCLTSWRTSVLIQHSLKMSRLVSETRYVTKFKFQYSLMRHYLLFIASVKMQMVSFRMWRILWNGGTQWSVSYNKMFIILFGFFAGFTLRVEGRIWSFFYKQFHYMTKSMWTSLFSYIYMLLFKVWATKSECYSTSPVL